MFEFDTFNNQALCSKKKKKNTTRPKHIGYELDLVIC